MEQQSLYDQLQAEERTAYSLFSSSPEILKTQVNSYYCPSRRSAPQLSTKDSTRGGVGPISGALTDYAINVGDGSVIPWYGSTGSAPRAANGFSPPTYRVSSGSIAYSGTLVTVSGDAFPRYRGWTAMRTFAEIRDGLSNTLMIGEKHLTPESLGDYNHGDGTYFCDDSVAQSCRLAGPSFPIATAPTDPELSSVASLYGRFGSWHAGGACQFAMGDGSVQSLSPAIDSTTLGYLANYDDQHVVSASDF
jgi:hypothetical protein